MMNNTINSEWKPYRLKYLFGKRIGGAWGNEPEGENSYVCLRAADIITDDISHKKNDLTKRSYDDAELKNKRLEIGDIIIEKSGGGENQPVGRVAVFDLEEIALCSNFMEILRPNKKLVETQFAAYLLYNCWFTRLVTKSIKQTTGIQNLDISDYLDEKAIIPSLKEQKQLVNWLNKEIDYLNKLVEKKQALINLLTEKRQALITQAVTKGLNPNVKMKNSGIDWLGKVPEHWEVKKLKYISNLKSGDFITAESIREEGQYPVFGGNGLRGYTNEKNHSGEYVLIGRQGALCGNINYTNGDFWASEHAIVCNPIIQYEEIWLGELLRLMNLNQYSIAAAQPGLSVEVIKNLQIPVPDFIEQKFIVEFIKKEETQIGKLLRKTKDSIDLLNERKSALITAAVTGQIEIPVQ